MAKMIIELLALLLCSIVTAIVFYWAVPRAGQLIALYRLHSLRDRLYLAGLRIPGFSETRFYRDIECFSSLAIQVVRDMPPSASGAYLEALTTPVHSDTEGSMYANEMDFLAAHAATVDELVSGFNQLPQYFFVRLMTSHPVILVGTFCAAIWGLLMGLRLRFVVPEPKPADALEYAVRAAESGSVASKYTERSYPLQAIRVIRRSATRTKGNLLPTACQQ